MDAQKFNAALTKAIHSALRRLPQVVGNEAVNFSLDNFSNQSWATEPWPKRKDPTQWGKVKRPGRALLVDAGHLRRSVRIIRLEGDAVSIGSSLPYAKAHNEGSQSAVVQSVKAYMATRGLAANVNSKKRPSFIGQTKFLSCNSCKQATPFGNKIGASKKRQGLTSFPRMIFLSMTMCWIPASWWAPFQKGIIR